MHVLPSSFGAQTFIKFSVSTNRLPGQIGDAVSMGSYNLGRQRQPTLTLVADLLQQVSLDLDSALEEKALLLAKVRTLS